MNSSPHIINKVILEIDTGRLADVSSLQEEVSSLLQRQAIPEIERLFDRLVGEEEVVRLDRVVVEVAPVDSRFLADEFVDKLLNALNQTLSDRLAVDNETETIIQERTQADWEVFLYFLEYGRLPWWCVAKDWTPWLPRWQAVMENETAWRSPLRQLLQENHSVQQRLIMQLPEAFRNQLVLQLQPAWTNWHTCLTEARWLMQGLNLSQDIVQKLEQQAWLLLLAQISSNNALMKPFPAAIWTRSWLHQLIQTWQLVASQVIQPPLPLSGEETPVRSQQRKTLPKQDEHPTPDSEETFNQLARKQLRVIIEEIAIAQRHIWQTALDQVLPSTSAKTIAPSASLSDQQREPETKFLDKAVSPVAESDASLPISNSDNVPEATALTAGQKDKSGDLPNSTITEDTALSAEESTPDVNPNLPSIKQGSQELSDTQLVSPQVSLPPLRASGSKLSPTEEEAGLYVTQAGLVLLHPFLSRYFDAVGLLEDKSFRDELAQQTAIYLLYYLTTKQTDAPEYELVLSKLLCGWPLNEPVARTLDLPEAALKEGEQLLQTAIDHWQALKSTSPDGLREGFLQRDGKLSRSSSGNWKLRVEQKAIDILLSLLPWGLSMVKLPWMEKILIVEWS